MTESLLYGCIIGVGLAQVLGYFWLDKKGIRIPKWNILLRLLTAQLVVLPQLLFSALGFGKNGCGMPIFGLLFYWAEVSMVSYIRFTILNFEINNLVASTQGIRYKTTNKYRGKPACPADRPRSI